MLFCVNGQDGLTPLHCAARSGQDRIISRLLERGAVIAAKSKNGLTPLHLAVQGNSANCVQLLLDHKAPIEAVSVVSLHCHCSLLLPLDVLSLRLDYLVMLTVVQYDFKSGWTLLKLNGDKVKLCSVVLRYNC